MKLKNILIVVNDVERSKKFYRDLFGLTVVADFGENVILTEGLVLQERKVWEHALGQMVCMGSHDTALYFEEYDIERFQKKLQSTTHSIEYVHPLIECEGGQRVIRIYDPDKHVIEIREIISQKV